MFVNRVLSHILFSLATSTLSEYMSFAVICDYACSRSSFRSKVLFRQLRGQSKQSHDSQLVAQTHLGHFTSSDLVLYILMTKAECGV